MTLHEYPDLEQGSEEWLAARRGIVTASVVGKLLTISAPSALDYACATCGALASAPCISLTRKEPTPIKTVHDERVATAAAKAKDAPPVLEVADNDTSRAITALLVAERITGWSEPTWFNADMQRGHDVEPIARDLYSQHYAPVTEMGFMVQEWRDGCRLGYSPDGLVGDDGLIEVKGPRMKAHLLTHLSGEVPLAHMAQIQAGLLVSGRQWCDFISFYGGMPPFIKRVERDQRWIDAILEAVEQFEAKAAEMQAEYETATAGLPMTDRLLVDMEIF